jgi:hypothetical protein
VLFLAGCEENQVQFHPQFDHIILLSAPIKTMLQPCGPDGGGQATGQARSTRGKTSAHIGRTRTSEATVKDVREAADGYHQMASQQCRRAVLRHEVAPRLSEHYGQGMGSYKDFLALAIATLAVVVSLVTVVLQQRQQKREAYRGLYEMLMSDPNPRVSR